MSPYRIATDISLEPLRGWMERDVASGERHAK